jgi:hypothetical protein
MLGGRVGILWKTNQLDLITSQLENLAHVTPW